MRTVETPSTCRAPSTEAMGRPPCLPTVLAALIRRPTKAGSVLMARASCAMEKSSRWHRRMMVSATPFGEGNWPAALRVSYGWKGNSMVFPGAIAALSIRLPPAAMAG